jgi:hypothetical protein
LVATSSPIKHSFRINGLKYNSLLFSSLVICGGGVANQNGFGCNKFSDRTGVYCKWSKITMSKCIVFADIGYFHIVFPSSIDHMNCYVFQPLNVFLRSLKFEILKTIYERGTSRT